MISQKSVKCEINDFFMVNPYYDFSIILTAIIK